MAPTASIGGESEAPGRYPRAHLWSPLHTRIAAARRARAALCGLACAALALAASRAGAADAAWTEGDGDEPGELEAHEPAGEAEKAPEAPPRDRAEASFQRLTRASVVADFEIRAGVGSSTLAEDGINLADFATAIVDVQIGVGTFVGPRVKLGYEATVGVRRVLGQHPEFARGSPVGAALEGNTGYLLPLGGYLAVYPWTSAGVSFGVHVGVGTFWPAEYMAGGNIELAGSAALDVGFERPWSESTRWALHLRYAATGFGRFHIDENYTDKQNSDELTLAAGVSWF